MSLLPDAGSDANTRPSPAAEALVAAALAPDFSAVLQAGRGEAWAVGWSALLVAQAAARDPTEAVEAFRAGVLSTIGKQMLRQAFPKGYQRCQRLARSGRDLLRVQRDLLGVDERQVAISLVRRWDVPAALAELLLTIDLPRAGASSETHLMQVVRLARGMTARLGLAGEPQPPDEREYAALSRALAISDLSLRNLEKSLKKDMLAWSSILLSPAPRELAPGGMLAPSPPPGAGWTWEATAFRAMVELDRALGCAIDLPNTVTAISRAAGILFGDACAGALAVCHITPEIEICLRGSADSASQRRELEPGFIQKLRQCGHPASPRFVEIEAQLARAIGLGGATPATPFWLSPLCHGARILGAILLREQPSRPVAAGDEDAFASLIAMFAQAIARANENTQSRKLTVELADSNRQLQAMQAELLRSRTLATMAEMAAGAGHELNGPLAVISGRAQLLASRSEDSELRRVLELISSKAHECSQIVSELMDFAKPPPPRRADFSIRDLLEQARDEWLQRAGLSASQFLLRLPSRPDELDACLHADRDQIMTVVVELLKNATEAIRPNNGKLTMEWKLQMDGPGATAADAGQGPVQRLLIQLSDTGEGMPPQVAQRAFDPFYSHRKAGRGRGLGLARAARIADEHGGRIQLESKVGAGTTVRVLLPLKSPARP